MHGKVTAAVAALAAALLSARGCVSPGRIDPRLVARYQREMARRGPQRRGGQTGLESLRPVCDGPDLRVRTDAKSGRTQILLSLGEAVRRALANSVDVKVISFDPAISREEMVQAAAAFDYTVFGGFRYDKQDERADPAFLGGHSQINTWNFGVKQKAVTGAEWQLEWSWVRTWDDSLVRRFPTRYEPSLRLEITQPLLRDAWPAVNLATLHIARLSHRQDLAEFRQKVEEIVTEVIARYWELVQARRDLVIQQSLLDKTKSTLKRIVDRGLIDATKVQIKQAEAAVESRRAALIRARKIIGDVQDELSRLLADKQINLLSTYEIVPTTDPARTEVKVDNRERLVTALRQNATLAQARLAIDIARVASRVARNQTLPRLDLTASAGLQGMGAGQQQAIDHFYSGDYLSYSVGLSLEYPIGNRERRAELRKRRYERLKAVATLQNLADQVAVQLNERIRQIHTTYQEIKAQQATVKAAKLQLQALEDTETIRARLSPEFLQVKLQAQETLAVAERAEIQAVIDYNTALTELDRVTGTLLDVHRVSLAETLDRWLAPPAKPRPLPRPAPTPAPPADKHPSASAAGKGPSGDEGP